MNYFRCGGGRSTHTATKIDVAKTPLATFESNASGLYIPEVLAYFSATQSGTGDPSPNNNRPINGVSSLYVSNGGQNLFDKNSPNIINNYRLSATGAETSTNGWLISDYIPVNENCFYKAIGLRASSGSTTCCCAYNSSKEFTRSYDVLANRDTDIVTETGDAYVRLSVRTLSDEQNTAQFIGGISAYINLGGTYYGGYLNVPTGLFTVTHLIANLGDCTFSGTVGSTGIIGTTSLVDAIKPVANADTANAYCSHYLVSRRNSLSDKAISVNPTGTVVLRDSTFADQSGTDLQTWLANNNVQFVYELATPQTYQLTPAQLEQLLGQNNVFCSADDVAVKYWKID